MKTLKKFIISILIIALHLTLVLVFDAKLPDDIEVAVQWSLQGEVGKYSSRAFGLWFLWIMSVALALLFIFFYHIEPRCRTSSERFDVIFPPIAILTSVLMLAIHLYVLLWAIEVEIVNQYNGVFLVIGFFFALLGIFLPKIPTNFFIGYRTPWTLSSDKIWKKTHRLAGYCFIISGILTAFMGFFLKTYPTIAVAYLILIAALCLFPAFYSRILFRSERKDIVDT